MTIINSILAGAIFGAGLTAAGVYSPSIIINQMQLSDFHMLKAFISASAISALAILAAQRLKLTTCTPRKPYTLSLFSKYDGNIIGGALLGSGMALSGACPGTLLPQLGTGVSSGPVVVLGAVVGGVVYSGWVKRFVNRKPVDAREIEKRKETQKLTVDEFLGAGKLSGVIGYEILCITILLITSTLAPENPKILMPAALGGFLIGLSQFTSLYLTASTLGVSNAYEQIGDLIWHIHSLISSSKPTPFPNIRGTAFPLGTILGTFILSHMVTLPVPHEALVVGNAKAFLGGVLIVVGGRIGGGCTSGHGISGMAQLSVSSVWSVVAMFGGGIVCAGVLRVLEL